MKRKITNGILYALAFIWCAITILPLLITVLSSFKNNDEIYLGMFEFPKLWRFSNYAAAAETADALVAIRKLSADGFFHHHHGISHWNDGFLHLSRKAGSDL